jgi:hypothetical protein
MRAVLLAAIALVAVTYYWPSNVAVGQMGVPASAPITFTVAGMESLGGPPYRAPCVPGAVCREPWRWPAAWPGTNARLTGRCAAHLPDGKLLLCEANRLLALGPDGRLRPWPTGAARFGVGFIQDVVVDSDGSAIALGESGVARVRPDGSSTVLARIDVDLYEAGVDVERDGGILVGGGNVEPDYFGRSVLRVASNGTVRRVAGSKRYEGANGDGGPATQAVVNAVDVAALPDGSFAIADSPGRIRVVDPAGVIRTVAGGGRGWRENAPATTVELQRVSSVQALPQGQLLVGSADGVFRIEPDGRIVTVLRGGHARHVPAASHLATDGAPAAASRFSGIRRSDVLPDGSLLIAQEIHTMGTRIAMITPPERMSRFAVALPRADRVLLRRGLLDIVSTDAASAVVKVIDRPRTIRESRVRLAAGRTRIRLRIRGTAHPLIVKVVARTNDGRVATHRLAVIVKRALSRRAVDLLRAAIEYEKEYESPGALFFLDRCRRIDRDRHRCRWSLSTDETFGAGHATLLLRRDGLITYTERGRRGRVSDRRVLEPQT